MRLTRLASGSRHVCEFLESETALGDTITGALRWEPNDAFQVILLPEILEEKERVRCEEGRSLDLEEVGTTPVTPSADKLAIGTTHPNHCNHNGMESI